MSESIQNAMPARRTLIHGAAWTVPAVTVATASPALAVSNKTTFVDYGLYVSVQNNGGYVGYNSANSTGVTRPTTPAAYYAAGATADSDVNWSDTTNSPTATGFVVNGEGSFTPASNFGTPGSYASTSGFWFSAPTTSPGTGTGYVPGSTVTLATGAQFTTTVSVTIPAGANSSWPLQNMTLSASMGTDQVWNKTLTGTTAASGPSNYLGQVASAGTWTAPAPTITTNADGSKTLTGTINYVTTAPVSFTQAGNYFYGQAWFMPATVKVNPAYGLTNFSLTSSVVSATLNYAVPAGYTAPATKVVTGLTTTSSIHL